MRFPNELNKQQKEKLKTIYNFNLKKNKDKGTEKSKNIARAKFYEEAFSIFMEKEKKIGFSKKTYLKEEKDYKVYKANNTKMIISTNDNIFKKFSSIDRKGKLGEIKDEYELEIFFKIKDKYPEISFSPEMYYVIK